MLADRLVGKHERLRRDAEGEHKEEEYDDVVEELHGHVLDEHEHGSEQLDGPVGLEALHEPEYEVDAEDDARRLVAVVVRYEAQHDRHEEQHERHQQYRTHVVVQVVLQLGRQNLRLVEYNLHHREKKRIFKQKKKKKKENCATTLRSSSSASRKTQMMSTTS